MKHIHLSDEQIHFLTFIARGRGVTVEALVQEIVEEFLNSGPVVEARAAAAHALRGSISDETADEMRRNLEELRGRKMW